METTPPPANLATAPTLLLVDGHSLAFRAYHAFANSREGGLRTQDGVPTSVCHGFLQTLLDVVGRERPQAMAIAFDRSEPTFRHLADPNYKANRDETPADFIPDVANLRSILEALGIPQCTQAGYEADDVLGTLAQWGSAAGYRVKILSGDRDLFQLVRDSQPITVLYLSQRYGKARSSPPLEIDPHGVMEKLGIPPSQVIDYKALCGDSSDNIPGVKGVGPKTAIQLLETYGSLEEIYDHLPEIKPAWSKKLAEDKEAAFLSQRLATIVTHVPLEDPWNPTLEACQFQGVKASLAESLFSQLQLKALGQRLPEIQALLSPGGASELDPISDALNPDFGGDPAGDPAGNLTDNFAGNSDGNPMDQADLSLNSSNQLELWGQTSPPGMSHPTPKPAINSTESVAPVPRVASFSGESSPPLLQPWIVDTPEKLQELVELLGQYTDRQNPVAWDTETTALEPREAQLVGIGCAWGEEPHTLAYIPLHSADYPTVPVDLALEMLRPILESETYPKALQNAKFDRRIFYHQGITLAGVMWDTLLASYLLDPEASHKLENLASYYLKFTPLSYQQLVPKGQTLAQVPLDQVAQYCAMDVHVVRRLVPLLAAELTQVPDLEHLRIHVEQPLEPVLAAMEDRGVRIDCAYLQQLSQQLEQELARLETEAHALAGVSFNLASPKQLSQILFETLGLDRKKSRKIKTGYSTDAAVLEKLQGDHPVVDLLLEHRTLAKLKSTYVDALPALVRSDTGRVHTDFNQAVTATGRLSSSQPNLQNIPIRTAFSRQIRKAFLPEAGWVMVSADYSQIELRILAHLTQEPVLLQAYHQGLDVHGLTAKLLLEKDEISPEERRLGKVINFGVIYGMGAQRFARETGVSVAEAKIFLERFYQRYPLVFAYLQQQSRQAIAQGYVSTILGRRRYFQFESARLRQLRGQDPQTIDLQSLKSLGVRDAGLLRAAANAPIQGSSADIIKIAMVKIAQLLQPYQARLLLQVHDELVFEIPPDEWPILEPKIRQTMTQAVDLRVPLQVDLHQGYNWMEAK